ncbi:unnamed protein product [Polarella glacialis]|uniref:Uncharacterized protein n=1 Tax=Polarella glacialis TaxID=89957 RepID=A0A813KJW0_POLGL|nr:unnamed protein product [Polarella glacialis]
MELLEDAQVQQALMELDSRSGGHLAAWEPPWALEGLDELDASALATVPAATLRAWAQSFAAVAVVQQLVDSVHSDAGSILQPMSFALEDQSTNSNNNDNSTAWSAAEDEVIDAEDVDFAAAERHEERCAPEPGGSEVEQQQQQQQQQQQPGGSEVEKQQQQQQQHQQLPEGSEVEETSDWAEALQGEQLLQPQQEEQQQEQQQQEHQQQQVQEQQQQQQLKARDENEEQQEPQDVADVADSDEMEYQPKTLTVDDSEQEDDEIVAVELHHAASGSKHRTDAVVLVPSSARMGQVRTALEQVLGLDEGRATGLRLLRPEEQAEAEVRHVYEDNESLGDQRRLLFLFPEDSEDSVD